MSKLSSAFLLIVFSSLAWADTTKCIIEVEDVNAGTKYKIEYLFALKSGSEVQRKHFALTGSNFSCTLAFFDLGSGTMLSCQLDELGEHFVQSDRSTIDEGLPKNNLSFRYKTSFYVLESHCK